MKKQLFLILLFLSTKLFAADVEYIVDKIYFRETFNGKSVSYIPFVKNAKGEQDKVTTRVNAYIKDRFMIRSFNPEYTDFRWHDVRFVYTIIKSHLHIEFTGEYQGEEKHKVADNMFFSLTSGESIDNKTLPLNSLFTLEGYFEFLHNNWVETCKKAIDESDCKFKPTPYDFDFEVLDKEISISLKTTSENNSCGLSHTRTYSLEDLAPYLSAFGKKIVAGNKYYKLSRMEKILFYKENKSALPEYYFVTGRVNDAYNVNLALELNKKDLSSVKGYYFYEDKFAPIELVGELNENIIYLREKDDLEGAGFKFMMHYTFKKTGLQFGDKYLTAKWFNSAAENGNYLTFVSFKMNK